MRPDKPIRRIGRLELPPSNYNYPKPLIPQVKEKVTPVEIPDDFSALPPDFQTRVNYEMGHPNPPWKSQFGAASLSTELSKTAKHIAGQPIQKPGVTEVPEREALKYISKLLSDFQEVIYTGEANEPIRRALSVVQNIVKGYIK